MVFELTLDGEDAASAGASFSFSWVGPFLTVTETKENHCTTIAININILILDLKSRQRCLYPPILFKFSLELIYPNLLSYYPTYSTNTLISDIDKFLGLRSDNLSA